jgi:hypothetical protein
MLARCLLGCLVVTASCLEAAQLKAARVTQVVKDVKLGDKSADIDAAPDELKFQQV